MLTITDRKMDVTSYTVRDAQGLAVHMTAICITSNRSQLVICKSCKWYIYLTKVVLNYLIMFVTSALLLYITADNLKLAACSEDKVWLYFIELNPELNLTDCYCSPEHIVRRQFFNILLLDKLYCILYHTIILCDNLQQLG